MIVLAVMSVLAIYIFVERFIAIKRAEKDDPMFMDRIRDYIKNSDVKSAVNFCRVTNTPAARMIERGISRMGRPAADVQSAIEIQVILKLHCLRNVFRFLQLLLEVRQCSDSLVRS